jgi:hypothetical protein
MRPDLRALCLDREGGCRNLPEAQSSQVFFQLVDELSQQNGWATLH